MTNHSNTLQQKRNEKVLMLKEIQKDNSETLMNSRVKILKSVLAKNKQLVDSVPANIAPEDIKRDFLKMRKNLMVRLIHSELRNKKVSEWTFNSLNKIQKNQMLQAEERPASVKRYNKLKAEALVRARFNQPVDT